MASDSSPGGASRGTPTGTGTGTPGGTPCTPPYATTPKSMKGHPQHISPSTAKWEDARLIVPFVREKRMLDLDSELQIGGKISPDVLHHVLQKYVDPVMRKAMNTYHHAEDGELTARPVLCHLFPIFWSMIPRGDLLEKYQTPVDEDVDLHIISSEMQKSNNMSEGQSQDSDFMLEGQQSQGQQAEVAPDSVCSMCGHHEDRSVMRERGALDFSFKCKLLSNFQWVWKLLLDAKDKNIGKLNHWKEEVVWQLLSYGAQYGLQNAKEGRLDILHLAGMQLGMLTFAQLHVFGTIEVANGEISKSSFDDYKQQEKFYVQNMQKRSPYFFVEERTYDDLKNELMLAIDEVKERNSRANFLDGWYIVGNVYIEGRPIKWDTFGGSAPSLESESMLAIEYFMEILIGRKTRSWNISDVEEVVLDNEKCLNRDEDYSVNKRLSILRYKDVVKRMNQKPPAIERATRKRARR